MTGCAAAIETARRYREAEARCPPLAYGLHLAGGRCRRAGGKLVCGECVGDVLPRDMPSRGHRRPPDSLKAFSATPRAQVAFRPLSGHEKRFLIMGVRWTP